MELYVTKKNNITIDLKPIYKALVEKGLVSNRNEIVKTTHQILVELFGKGETFSKDVSNIIIEGMNNKNMKIVSGCIDAITPLLTNYGIARLGLLKPFLK